MITVAVVSLAAARALDDCTPFSTTAHPSGGSVTTHPATLGRFFEDYVVGDVYQHPVGRTITDTDNAWATCLSMNTNQNHFNEHLARANPVTDGRVIVNSGLTIALVLGLSVIDMSQNAVANLEFTDVKLSHPVYVGDTICSKVQTAGSNMSSTDSAVGSSWI